MPGLDTQATSSILGPGCGHRPGHGHASTIHVPEEGKHKRIPLRWWPASLAKSVNSRLDSQKPYLNNNNNVESNFKGNLWASVLVFLRQSFSV